MAFTWLFWCSMTSSYEFCRLYVCYISNTLFELQAGADGNLEKAKISGVATPILFSRLAPSQSKHKHCDHWQLFVFVSVAKFNHLSPLRTASSRPWSSWHLRVFWYCCLGALQWMAVVLARWWRKQMRKEWNRYHHTRNRLNSLCRSLLVRRSFSWKGLQTMESDMVNYQKRYLAISWNTISSLMFACKACSFLFHILAGPKAIPEAIPKRYPSGT